MATTKPSRLQSISRVVRRAFPHIVLITVYLGYLVLGACVFCRLEHQIQAKEFLRARNHCKSAILDKMENMTNGNKTGKWLSLSLCLSVYISSYDSLMLFISSTVIVVTVTIIVIVIVVSRRHLPLSSSSSTSFCIVIDTIIFVVIVRHHRFNCIVNIQTRRQQFVVAVITVFTISSQLHHHQLMSSSLSHIVIISLQIPI